MMHNRQTRSPGALLLNSGLVSFVWWILSLFSFLGGGGGGVYYLCIKLQQEKNQTF